MAFFVAAVVFAFSMLCFLITLFANGMSDAPLDNQRAAPWWMLLVGIGTAAFIIYTHYHAFQISW